MLAKIPLQMLELRAELSQITVAQKYQRASLISIEQWVLGGEYLFIFSEHV